MAHTMPVEAGLAALRFAETLGVAPGEPKLVGLLTGVALMRALLMEKAFRLSPLPM